MEKKRWIELQNIFFVLSCMNIAIKLIYKADFFDFVLFAFLLLLFLCDRLPNEEYLVFMLFLPNKYLQLLALPIFLLKRKYLLQRRINRDMAIFLIYITFFGTVSCICYGGFFPQTLFQIGLYYCYFQIMISMRNCCSGDVLWKLLDKMFWLQCITGIMQMLYCRHAGDRLTGTLISAHILGIFLIMYMYLCCAQRRLCGGGKAQLLLGIPLLYLADAKHCVCLFLIILLVCGLLKLVKVRNVITCTGVCFVAAIVICVSAVRIPEVRQRLEEVPLAATYIYNEQYNKKVEMLENTLRELKGIHSLVGFGAGQFGSQISITMSKGVIYSWNSELKAYSYGIAPYLRAVQGLMTEEYTKGGIGISSMVLGYPLVSFIGLLAELGILGMLLLFRLLDRFYADRNRIFLVLFFGLTLFDTYFEIPCVFLMLVLGTELAENFKHVESNIELRRGKDSVYPS